MIIALWIICCFALSGEVFVCRNGAAHQQLTIRVPMAICFMSSLIWFATSRRCCVRQVEHKESQQMNSPFYCLPCSSCGVLLKRRMRFCLVSFVKELEREDVLQSKEIMFATIIRCIKSRFSRQRQSSTAPPLHFLIFEIIPKPISQHFTRFCIKDPKGNATAERQKSLREGVEIVKLEILSN